MQSTPPVLVLKTRFEFPTWLLIIGVYGVWSLLVVFNSDIYPPLWLVLMSMVLALFGSLCHELLHGHPSNSQKLNDAIGTPPLSLYPYFDYKSTHLQHHDDAFLTEPGIDPESFFVRSDQWRSMSRMQRGLARFNMTLTGRLLFGPMRTYIGLGRQAISHIRGNDALLRRQWLSYIVSVALLLWLLVSYFHVSLGLYVLAAYMGHALIALRSFYEHQAHAEPEQRTVIVVTALPFSFLFLFNNLHVVHHQHPGLAWYLIPGEYQQHKESYLQSNGGFNFVGYRAWLKFLFRPVASPVFRQS
jgi:fatty acid desaturase